MIQEEEISILLVEDFEADEELVRHYLRSNLKQPYELRVARSMAGAATEIAHKRPDIVLLDLSLPDSMNADSLDFVLKNRRRFPMIVLSGYDVPEIRKKAIKSGAQDYLVKGEYDGKLLARVINYSLERQYLQRKLRNFAKKLNDQRLKLVEAQALAQMGNWELDAFDLQFTWSNQAMKILEFQTPTTSLPDFLKIVEADDQKIVREVLRQSIEDNSEFNIDVAVRLDGDMTKHINLRVRSNNARDLQHKLVVGTIQDITSRKMIEDDLKQSEEKYYNLFEESRDAIYITTRDGNFIEFNKATTELFDYSKEELKILNVTDLYLNPFERVKFAKEISEKGFVRDFELQLRRRDGTKLDCIITSTLWKSNDGRLKGYQGVIRDITEKRRGEELIKEKEVAERSGKLKERFLANMSHEIRTPINAISGLTHLMLNSTLDARQQEYISGIKSSAEHLLELVNDILDFSKIGAGKVKFESIPFNVHMILNQLIGALRFKAAEKKLDLQLDIDPEVPYTIKGDPLKLKQILINLIGNSIKFTDQGFIKLSVRVIERNNLDYVLSFSVEDTGIGIPEDKLGTIFSSFTQLGYDMAKPEGTGLGLTISKQLVELLGGTINVKSKIGDGTTFKVVLKYKMAETQLPDNTKEDAFNFKVDDIGHRRVLIVEDKPLNQLVAKEMLMKWWPIMDIDVADNGRIAVGKIELHQYDLVLMDVQMPEMDGYEATRHIRKMPLPTCQVPIIAMTAFASTGEVDKCLEAGMNDYISKPFEPRQLYDKIVNQLLHRVPEAMLELTAAAPAPVVEGDRLDLTYLNKLAGDNDNLKKQIIELLLTETPEEVDTLTENTRIADWPRVRGISHKMKSAATYMGLQDTLALLKKIEEYSGKAFRTELIPDMVDTVRRNFDNALEELKAK